MTEMPCSGAAVRQPAEISVSTAARIAKCSPDTVLRWIEEGAIAARRISPRGWWKIERGSLIQYLERISGRSLEMEEFKNTANSARFSRAAHRF